MAVHLSEFECNKGQKYKTKIKTIRLKVRAVKKNIVPKTM